MGKVFDLIESCCEENAGKFVSRAAIKKWLATKGEAVQSFTFKKELGKFEKKGDSYRISKEMKTKKAQAKSAAAAKVKAAARKAASAEKAKVKRAALVARKAAAREAKAARVAANASTLATNVPSDTACVDVRVSTGVVVISVVIEFIVGNIVIVSVVIVFRIIPVAAGTTNATHQQNKK